MGPFLLIVFLMFVINYFAARMAVKPLLCSDMESLEEKELNDITQLRDMGVLDNDELVEIIKLISHKYKNAKEIERYQKYAGILKNLRDMEYFTDEECCLRMKKLKEQLKIDEPGEDK